MQKLYLAFLLILCGTVANAQINGPDTVCLGTPVEFTTSYSAKTYAWAPDTIYTSTMGMSATKVLQKGDLEQPRGMVIKPEAGNYYGFVVENDGELIRLDFGSNPTSTPSTTNLGDLGGVLGDSCIGLDIAQDGGSWYGFITCNKRLIRLNFGNSLSNTPTATVVTSPLAYGYQITLVKFNSEWLGFVANRFGFGGNNIARLDFGNSLTNVPTMTTISTFGAVNAPVNFSLFNDNGAWYMLVVNLGNGNLTRFSFSTNLKNNSPAAISLGNPNNRLFNPRAISIIADENDLYALITNESSRVTKVSFRNGITNTPTATDLGKFSIDGSKIAFTSTLWHNNQLYMFGSSYSDTCIYRYNNIYSLPANSQTALANNGFSQTMNKKGLQTVTLHCDQGLTSGPRSFSKEIFVVDAVRIAIKQWGDTLYASGTPCEKYVWRFNNVEIPGAEDDTLIPTQEGIYSVTGSIASCSDISTFQYFSVGVNGVANAQALDVFPNPSTGLVNIKVNGIKTANATIKCYNTLGTLVATKEVAAVNSTVNTALDMSALPKGTYHILLQTADGSRVSKQVVLQ